MRTYELVTILSPMLNQEQATEAWGRIKEFITTRDAEITREQTWGTRRLAYPIRKGSINFLEGSYYLTQFATERPFNFDLEVFLHRDERVLRSLVTVADPDAPLAHPGMAAAAAAAARVAAEAAAAAAAEAAAAAAEAAPAETPAAEVSDTEATVTEATVTEATVLTETAVEQPAADSEIVLAVETPPAEEETGDAPVAEVASQVASETTAEAETAEEPAVEPAPVIGQESPESEEERSEV